MNLPRIKWKIDLVRHSKNIPHSHFNDVLGLTATRTWNMADTVSLPPLLRHSAWEYSIEEFGVKSIDEVFLKFVSALSPYVAEMKHLIKEYDLEAQFVCVIEAVDGEDPEVILSAESVAFLAELGARLCFDLYYYPEGGAEDTKASGRLS